MSYRLRVLNEKSFFVYPAVRLLGYVVNGDGILRTEDRINVFKKITFPYSLFNLNIYLDITNYLRLNII